MDQAETSREGWGRDVHAGVKPWPGGEMHILVLGLLASAYTNKSGSKEVMPNAYALFYRQSIVLGNDRWVVEGKANGVQFEKQFNVMAPANGRSNETYFILYSDLKNLFVSLCP